ncbi:transporter [Lithospermum erythrorhizon]|uniref:Transporter n=1 Tax=Lithospermum erythrorhizon TaxID=34254 RepID=A0AAV3QHB8_LITER
MNNSSNDEFCSAYVTYNSQSLLLNLKDPSNLLSFDLPRIHLQLAFIFILTHFLHYFLFRRILMPIVVSQIMAGIILGPMILGRIRGFEEKWFPVSGELFLDYLSRMGFIFFIFSWGVKMDPKMILKTGRRGWIVGVSVTVLPTISGFILLKHFQKSTNIKKWKTITYVVSTNSYVSLPMVASALVQQQIINTELGHLALSSGLITNLINILFTTIVYSLRQVDLFSKLQYFGAYGFLLLVIVIIVRPLSYWIIKQTPGTKPVNSLFVIMMWILVFATVILADHIGVPHELAAFLFGLIGVPDGPPLGSSLVQKLETLVDGLLAPLMVSYCGTKVNIGHYHDLKYIGTLWILVGCCLVIKVVSLLLPALVVKVPPRDTVTLAFIMSSQGIVQISSHLFLLTVEVQCC